MNKKKYEPVREVLVLIAFASSQGLCIVSPESKHGHTVKSHKFKVLGTGGFI